MLYSRSGAACRCSLACFFGVAPQLWLNKQHRYVQDIADLVDQIHTSEPLMHIRGFFFDVARTHGACLYLSVDGKAEVNAKSNSRFNNTNVERVVYIVMVALEQHSFQGTDIVVTTDYAAQLHLYLAAQNAMVDQYFARANGSRLAEQAKLVRFVTIDSI